MDEGLRNPQILGRIILIILTKFRTQLLRQFLSQPFSRSHQFLPDACLPDAFSTMTITDLVRLTKRQARFVESLRKEEASGDEFLDKLLLHTLDAAKMQLAMYEACVQILQAHESDARVDEATHILMSPDAVVNDIHEAERRLSDLSARFREELAMILLWLSTKQETNFERLCKTWLFNLPVPAETDKLRAFVYELKSRGLLTIENLE